LIFFKVFLIDVKLYKTIPTYSITYIGMGNGKVLNFFITSFTISKLFIFYHYDTTIVLISIGIKNQFQFRNRYEAPVIVSYFGD